MDSQQVIVQKCNPNFSNSDPECNVEVPYFKDPYTVVIIGTLNDMDATQATVEFDVTIGPDVTEIACTTLKILLYKWQPSMESTSSVSTLPTLSTCLPQLNNLCPTAL